MVLPNSGSISLLDIQNEFGGSNPISLSEYYRNGGYVPSNNTNVPTSGTISLSDFYGAVNEIVVYITSTSTNVNAQTLFGSYWTQNIPKRLVINSGVTLGATSVSNYALTIPTALSGTLRVDNNGSIQGAGGAANSGTGGNAILASSAVSINNLGTIYSGGGGGGLGGAGGGGYYYYDCSYTACGGGSGFWCNANSFDEACQNQNGPSSYCISPNYHIPCCNYDSEGSCRYLELACCNCCTYYSQTCTAYTSGGAGGAGGRGQGYDGNFASGSGGSGGDTNAGTGGTGGTGGDWGATGSTGGTGSNGNYTNGSAGSTGGLAGYYIVNNGNVTWISTGTRLGRVG